MFLIISKLAACRAWAVMLLLLITTAGWCYRGEMQQSQLRTLHNVFSGELLLQFATIGVSLHNVGQCVGSHTMIHSLSLESNLVSIVSKYLIILSNTVNRQSALSTLSSLGVSVKTFSNISPRSERPPSDPRQQYTGEESCTTERQRMLWWSDVRCNIVIMWSDDGAQTGIGQSPHWWLDWAWVQRYLPGPGYSI